MTRKVIWKDFFKKTVLTIVIAIFLFLIAKSILGDAEQTDYMLIWLLCGIPFGIRRMFVWLVPHGYDIGATLGIFALNFIIGGIIGGFILIWRLIVAVWYIPLTIYRLAVYPKNNVYEENLYEEVIYEDNDSEEQ